MHEENPQCVFIQRYILTLTETESRLSLGMTSNKTYNFQITVNHYRFIKVWTSIADLPTSEIVVQIFILEKVWLRNTIPTYDLDICPNFLSFFGSFSLGTVIFFLASLIISQGSGYGNKIERKRSYPMLGSMIIL